MRTLEDVTTTVNYQKQQKQVERVANNLGNLRKLKPSQLWGQVRESQ